MKRFNKKLVYGRLPKEAFQKDLLEVLEPYARKHYEDLKRELEMVEAMSHSLRCKCKSCYKKHEQGNS